MVVEPKFRRVIVTGEDGVTQTLATAAKQLPDNHNVTVSNMISAVETGLAKEAKQLADNHNVTVSNQITGFATEAKQLPDNHNVTVSNMISAVETGLAKETTNASILLEKKVKATIIDEASATITYVGEAEAGTATNAALWRIRKIELSGTLTISSWADGNTNFDNVWDNRATTVIYS